MLFQTKSLLSEDVCYFVFQEISKQHVFKGQSKGNDLLCSFQSQDKCFPSVIVSSLVS